MYFSTIIVQATITFARHDSAEAGLSYLGFGVPQEIPSWGNMLYHQQMNQMSCNINRGFGYHLH